MTDIKLSTILPHRESGHSTDSPRWQTTVPLITNPFLLYDVLQFSFVGAALVFLTLELGVWVTEGGISSQDIKSSLAFSGWVFTGIITAYVIIACVFFRNRYFALYQFNDKGIYYEGSRGSDGRKDFFPLCLRSYPVIGTVAARRTLGRSLPWGKIDSFVNIPSMRVVHLKRGYWSMLRLYTPDDATHARVIRYLAALPQMKNKK